MFGIVYLVQPEEYLNTSTYKIGMSASNTTKRIRDYGKHTRAIAIIQCKEPRSVEAALIKAFNKRFTLERGREFFSGNEKEMILAFHECISPDIVVDNEDKPENDGNQDSPDIIVENNIEPDPQDSPEYLLLQQRLNTPTLNREIYDLLMMLPDEWFKYTDNIDRMVYGLRNTIPVQSEWLYSVKRVLQERWDYCNDHYILLLVMKKLTTTQSRITLCGLKKQIRLVNGYGYELWNIQYNAKNKIRKIVYKEGNSIPLKFAQELLPKGHAHPQRLSKINPKIVIEKHRVCTFCNQIYKAGCCSKHNRLHRSTRSFIMNANII